MPFKTIAKRRAYDRERWKLPHRKAQDKAYRGAHRKEKSAITRRWKLKHPKRVYRWYWTWRGTSQYLRSKAKSRAKALGIAFALSVDDIPVPEFCPVLGIPLFPGTKTISDNSPSVDRVRLDTGYVPGNVRVISYRANRLKSNATIAEIERLLDYMKREQAC